MWEMFPPKGLGGVASKIKASKITNMGNAAALNLLGYYADEWDSNEDKGELVTYTREITSLLRRKNEASHAQTHATYNAIFLLPEQEDTYRAEAHRGKGMVPYRHGTLNETTVFKAYGAELSIATE